MRGGEGVADEEVGEVRQLAGEGGVVLLLAGVEAQFDSEADYSNIKKAVGEQGVIFVGSREGLKNYPEIFRKWFGKVIPIADNKFSALN